MTNALRHIADEALQLPPDDRVTLAETLLLTVDEEHDHRVDEATIAMLERRLRDIESGRVRGIPADEALQSVRASLNSSRP